MLYYSRALCVLSTVLLLCCVFVIVNKFGGLQFGKAVSVLRRMIHRHPRPVFPDNYHSTGLLRLPRSGIKEPFEIWFSHQDQKSRVDFYYGEYGELYILNWNDKLTAIFEAKLKCSASLFLLSLLARLQPRTQALCFWGYNLCAKISRFDRILRILFHYLKN